ncbi:MAG: hypothetical protein H6818_08755 [Phycisphaerales bacterium]|nr:hypothetical protein [Phycisphaerales bacterium]MCB9862660.1 hypothetical protein [Phycisphaerales bacterium]
MDHSDEFAKSEVSLYRPSGRIDVLRSIPWLLLLGFGIFFCAAFLTFVFHMGWYLELAMPIFASMILSVPLVLLISHGRWRNPWLAVVVGVLSALTVYLGQYHLDLVWNTGLSSITRLDVLPDYIAFRMDTDVSRPSYVPESREYAPTLGMRRYLNWGGFGFEIVLMLAFPIAFAWPRAQRPFCESCKQWMRQSKVAYAVDRASDMASMVDAGRWDEIRNLTPTSIQTGKPGALLLAAYCGEVRMNADGPCPVYLSVKPTSNAGSALGIAYEDTNRSLIRDRRLSSAEAAELSPLFQELKGAADSDVVRGVEASVRDARKAEAASLRVELDGKRIAIEEIEGESNPRGFVALKGLFLQSMGLLALFGGLVSLIVGFMLAWPIIDPASTFVIWEGCPAVLAWSCVVLGVASVAYGWFVTKRGVPPSFDRFVYQLLCDYIEKRPGRIVEPDAEGVHFVQIIPRANWHKIKPVEKKVAGLLRIDRQRGEILFEGDSRRIRIPIQAVSGCEADAITNADGSVQDYVVIVRANDGTREVELPFSPYADDYRKADVAKRDAMQALFSRFAAVVVARHAWIGEGT